ncbi:hypothetical protein FXF51_20385 [Nonomuraea sp. PA05]|uniref:hypothetical protein n=1 Tax=Nonomuraea sp. PA05 TaxID=2604466 RepID=UPI0011DB67C2|nr:hypothetical protein [Nonomuraea sp. PA05]TYB64813.1 hypothetical protein FXF51_20385 [Nonomuraea sp. PA05]
MAEHARHGVCVITVRCPAGAPPTITVSVRLDVHDSAGETRRHVTTEGQAVEEIRAFLRALDVPE